MQQVPCAGNNTVGIATRFCSINGTWSPFVDASNCTSAAFNEIMAMVRTRIYVPHPVLVSVECHYAGSFVIFKPEICMIIIFTS